MKSRLLFSFVLSLILLSSSAFSQSSGIFENFKIPTYEAKYLVVYGQDFLNYTSTGSDNSSLKLAAGAAYGYMNQSPMMTYSVTEVPGLAIDKSTVAGVSNDAVNTYSNTLLASVNKYFGQYDGVFGFGNLGFSYYENLPASITRNLPVTVGVGYGRITGAKTVAQALVIVKELGISASDETVLAIADVIAKHSSNYYAVTYKDDAEIMYFKDLAALTGKADAALKISQILGGGIYQITDRMVGWQVKAGFSNDFTVKNGAGDAQTGNLVVQAEYARPMGLDRQFYGSVTYSNSLNDKAKWAVVNSLNVDASYTIEHSYLWATSLLANYGSYMPKPAAGTGVNAANLSLSAKSTYVVLSKLSAYGQLTYGKLEWNKSTNAPSGVKDATIALHLGFSYLVF